MGDFGDYFEATTGFGGSPYGDYEDAEEAREVAAVQRTEKDAVLCLVDARAAMFTLPNVAPDGQVKPEKDDDVGRDGSWELMTPFRQAMRMVGRLYQEKIITSDRDLLGLVLYNTAQSSNPCELPGVYVIHPYNTLDVERVQEVEQLEAAGVPGSGAYGKFLKDIGHRNPTQPAALDEALWMSQHMLLTVRANVVKYRRIFIFTNDDDPTKGDVLQLRRCVDKMRTLHDEGVVTEVFALGHDGGHGIDADCADGEPGRLGASDTAGGGGGHSGSSHRNNSLSTGTGTGSGPGAIFSSVLAGSPPGVGSNTLPAGSAQGNEEEAASLHSATVSSAQRTATTSDSGPIFRRGKFWDRLVSEAAAQQQPTWASATPAASSTAGYVGGVHVQSALHGGDMEDSMHAVIGKLHPQRPFMNTTLTIGMRSDGGAVPRMAVSLFTPIMAATGPKSERLEASTNALVKRQARLVRKPARAPLATAAEEEAGDDGGSEGVGDGARSRLDAGPPATLRREDVRYGVAVADTFVPFTKEERAKVTEVAAAGAPPGYTILCFKSMADALVFKHALQRSSFLHPNLSLGGEDSLRCFVQLVRTMRRQGKVAIALYLRNARSAPRLVALVPSPPPPDSTTTVSSLPLAPPLQKAADSRFACAESQRFPVESLPAEGMGLYVVPLPYADDIRPLPPPPAETSMKAEKEEEEAPAAKLPDNQVHLAERIIDALTVPYDITAVANPSVQLQYHMLKRLAVQNLAANTKPRGGMKEEGGPPVPSRATDGFHDFTQPDWEGMRKHASLFREFNSLVLGPGYSAEELCPQPKPAAGTVARRPRTQSPSMGGADATGAVVKSEEEAEDIRVVVNAAAEAGTWHKLTVAQLRAYLKASKAAGGGAKRKEELIASAKDVYAAGTRSKVKEEEK